MSSISITAANVVPGTDAIVQKYTAGATITAGQLVYADSTALDAASQPKVKAADNDASLATSTLVGLALGGAANNQPLLVQSSGSITVGAVLTAGETYVLSADATGTLAPIADLATGKYVVHVGVATSSSVLQLAIRNWGVQHA